MDQRERGGSRRGNVAGLLFVVLLLAFCIWLVQVLRERSRIEDCQLSGRHDCVQLDRDAR